MFLAAPELHYQLAAFGGLGWPEVLIILLVVLLLFGGKKLPEIARGTGRALRIFKAETKGLRDDDDPDAPATTSAPTTGTAPREITDREVAPPPAAPAATPERDLHDR
jgi:sec-independent protein translocase protein TatA